MKRCNDHSKNHSTLSSRRRFKLVAGLTAVLVLFGGLGTPNASADYPPEWRVAQFWLDSSTYGPNQVITISMGTIAAGCDPWPGTTRISAIYVVPAGSVSAGGSLADVSGVPNTVFSALAGGGIIDEVIGMTAPAGTIGQGTYDIVEDVCQDGLFDAGTDAVLANAFTVTIGSGVPPIPNAAINSMKEQAAQEYAEWLEYSNDIAFAGIVFALATVPYGQPAIIVEMIIAGLSFIVSCTVDNNCQVPFTPFSVFQIFANLTLAATSKAAHYQGIAADPPNPDFLTPVTLIEPQVLTGTPENSLHRAFLDYSAAIDDSSRLIRGLLDAIEKYQGAQIADNAPAALMQAQAASGLADQLTAALARENASADSLLAAINALPVDQADWLDSVSDFQQRLTTFGLTVADRAQLASLGLTTPAQQQSFVDDIMAIPTTGNPIASIISGQKTGNIATIQAVTTLGTAFDGLATTISSLITSRGQTAHPVVSITAPASTTVGVPATLTATAPGATSLRWDFDGDGQFDDATGFSVSYTPTRPGPQRPGVLVEDSAGRQTIAYVGLDTLIVGSAPTVTSTPVSGSSLAIYDNETVDLTAVFTDPDGDPLTITWLDNGTPVTAVGNTYQAPGSSTERVRGVVARAVDSAGNITIASWMVFSVDSSTIPAVVDLSVAPATKVYGDTDPAYTLTGLPSGWAAGSDYTVSFDRAPGENVGDYDISAQVTILAPGFTLGTVETGTLTVTPRPLSVSIANVQRQHTGSQQNVDLAVGAFGLRNGDSFSPATFQVSGTNVGSYPSALTASDITVSRGADNVTSNYTISITQGGLTITTEPAPTPITGLSIQAVSKMYGDPDSSDYVIEGWPAGWTASDYQASFIRMPGETVGTYQVGLDSLVILRPGFTFEGSLASVMGELTITPRPITVTVGSLTRTHTGQPITVGLPVTVTAGSLAGTDVLATTTVTVTGTAVGSYQSNLPIDAVLILDGTQSVAGSYAITMIQGALTIQAGSPSGSPSDTPTIIVATSGTKTSTGPVALGLIACGLMLSLGVGLVRLSRRGFTT